MNLTCAKDFTLRVEDLCLSDQCAAHPGVPPVTVTVPAQMAAIKGCDPTLPFNGFDGLVYTWIDYDPMDPTRATALSWTPGVGAFFQGSQAGDPFFPIYRYVRSSVFDCPGGTYNLAFDHTGTGLPATCCVTVTF